MRAEDANSFTEQQQKTGFRGLLPTNAPGSADPPRRLAISDFRPFPAPFMRQCHNGSFMRRLTGPALLESILNRDWPWAGFGIGDLDPQWIEHCEWWQSAGTVVLLFDGLKPRLVCPYGDTSGLAPILASVTDEHIWANVRPEVEDIFLRFYGPDKVVLLRRMYLDRPVTRTGEALPLSLSDRLEIEELLKQGEWVLFLPQALASGHCHGVRENGRLIAIAGRQRYTGLRVCHFPRVKSGNFCGALPLATLASLNGMGALHAAAS